MRSQMVTSSMPPQLFSIPGTQSVRDGGRKQEGIVHLLVCARLVSSDACCQIGDCFHTALCAAGDY